MKRIFTEEQVSSSGWEDSFLDDELVRIEDLLSVANIIGRQYSKDYLREKLSECKIDDSTLDFPKLLEKLEELSRDFDPCAHAMLQKAFKVGHRNFHTFLKSIFQLKNLFQSAFKN